MDYTHIHTPEEGFSFEYDKPYPSNVPLSGILTLGYVTWPEEESSIGMGLTEEHIIHGASLRTND